MLNIEYKENLEEEFYKIIDDEFNKIYRFGTIANGFHSVSGRCAGGKSTPG